MKLTVKFLENFSQNRLEYEKRVRAQARAMAAPQ
jgi:ribosomal protein S30